MDTMIIKDVEIINGFMIKVKIGYYTDKNSDRWIKICKSDIENLDNIKKDAVEVYATSQEREE